MRSTNAGTRIEPPAVQAPEKQENLLLVIRVDADAVVFNSEYHFFQVVKGIDFNHRQFALLFKLNSIGNEVLKRAG